MHRRPNGPASLGYHGFNNDVARQRDADGSGIVVIAPQEQAVLASSLRRAGQPTNLGGGGIGVVQSQQKVLRRERHRIGQQDELWLVPRVDPQGGVPIVRSRVQAGQVVAFQPDGMNVDAGEAGGRHGNRRFLLDLAAAADDAAAGATQHQSLVPQQFGNQFGKVGIVRGILRRREDHCQVCRRVAHVRADGRRAFGKGGAQAVLLR